MASTPTASHQLSTPNPQGGVIVSWMLILLALGALTPCVLLPQWRQYQALCGAQAYQQHRVDALQRRVEDERRLLSALRSDPAVIARLARREYGFHQPGEQVIPVTVGGTGSPVCGTGFPAGRLTDGKPGPTYAPSFEQPGPLDQSFIPKPVRLPPILASAASFLPSGYDYDQVFCSQDTRLIIMAMSVGLIGVALSLRRPRGIQAR